MITTTPRRSDHNHWTNDQKHFYVYFFNFLMSSNIFIFLVYWLPHELAKLRACMLAWPRACRAYVRACLCAYVLACSHVRRACAFSKVAISACFTCSHVLHIYCTQMFYVLTVCHGCLVCLFLLYISKVKFQTLLYQKILLFVTFNMFFYLHQFYLCSI